MVTPRECLLLLAEEAGLEFNTYLRQQRSADVSDAGCLTCGYVEEECVDPGTNFLDCPICGAYDFHSFQELMVMRNVNVSSITSDAPT